MKKYQQQAAADAYQTFSQLHQHGMITANELVQWRQIIGHHSYSPDATMRGTPRSVVSRPAVQIPSDLTC